MTARRETKSAGNSQILSRWVWSGIDLIFPPSCAGCGKPTIRWCCDCEAKILAINGPVCGICGLPRSKKGICQKCTRRKPAFTKLRSWAIYADPVRRALLRLKYSNDISLGEMFATKLVGMFTRLGWKVDMVIPVPLGRLRQHQRGYNQSDLIARTFASNIGLDYEPKTLGRIRETNSQVGLELSERENNVHGAFAATGAGLKGRRVLLIDDIATTGATLSACADALLAADVSEVLALTLARAI